MVIELFWSSMSFWVRLDTLWLKKWVFYLILYCFSTYDSYSTKSLAHEWQLFLISRIDAGLFPIYTLDLCNWILGGENKDMWYKLIAHLGIFQILFNLQYGYWASVYSVYHFPFSAVDSRGFFTAVVSYLPLLGHKVSLCLPHREFLFSILTLTSLSQSQRSLQHYPKPRRDGWLLCLVPWLVV